jgi:hypothetical protein
MRKIIIISLVTFCFSIGCVSDYNGVLPESVQIPVLNGVLFADSLFSINLTLSNHPNEKEFLPIKNASFQLKKNGVPISPYYTYSNDGTYTFTDTCFNDNSFEIEAKILGYPTLSAKTIIPNKPVISLGELNNQGNKRAS